MNNLKKVCLGIIITFASSSFALEYDLEQNRNTQEMSMSKELSSLGRLSHEAKEYIDQQIKNSMINLKQENSRNIDVSLKTFDSKFLELDKRIYEISNQAILDHEKEKMKKTETIKTETNTTIKKDNKNTKINKKCKTCKNKKYVIKCKKILKTKKVKKKTDEPINENISISKDTTGNIAVID